MLRFKKNGCEYPSWETVLLNDVVDVYDGTHQTPEYVDEGVRFVSVENIGDLYNSTKYISQEAYSRDYKVKAEKGDVLMTRIGDIGSAAVVSGDEELAYYVSLALLKCKGINPYYLLHLIHSPYYKKELWKRTLHTAFPKKINKGDIGLCSVLLPCEEEQGKIADCLSSIDAVIADYEAQVENMQNQKKGVMQKLFSQEVRFKADDGSDYPGWEKQDFDNICDTVTDYVAAGSFAALRDNVSYIDTPAYAQLIRTTDLKNGFKGDKFVYVNEHAYKFLWRVDLSDESIIMPNVGNCGEVYYIRPEYLPYNKNVLGPNAILVRSSGHNNKFIAYLLQQKDFQIKLKLITSPAGQTKFNKTELKKLVILMPCLDEQQKIADCLSAFDEAIEDLQKTVEHWKNIKKGLLQQLFA